MKNYFKIFTFLITLFLVRANGSVSFTWQTGFDFDAFLPTTEALDFNNDPLPGSGNSSSNAFIQLIKIESGFGVEALDLNNPTGVSTGNSVVAFSHVGFGTGQDGIFSVTGTYSLNQGDEVFIRLWDAPSENFSLGHAPLNSGTYYGNSVVHSVNIPTLPSPAEDVFEMPTTATTIMIPEPGTLALILMAVGGIVYKLRRRRS
jgi:hypothetical protein